MKCRDQLGPTDLRETPQRRQLVTNVCGVAVPATGGPVARNDYIRRCADGADVVDVPPAVAATIRRYAPVAVAMNDFYWDLFGDSRATPYPAEKIRHAMSAIRDLTEQPTPGGPRR
ncbi:hypothetical protein [Micromonospora sp. WMMD1082]|uniref:hypothetical protein n=1 Tax=Micromonospora sp. WMMD1082 TaxID=3016104 RepID=UPI002416654A|nr:hypothetical protein [Micromonospora sp. WMMD1082]MDG4797732.1 hypothetical protein [Micromonospora sp. WMMD1082]